MRRAHWLRIQKEMHFNLLENCVQEQEKEQIVPGPLIGLKDHIARLHEQNLFVFNPSKYLIAQINMKSRLPYYDI